MNSLMSRCAILLILAFGVMFPGCSDTSVQPKTSSKPSPANEGSFLVGAVVVPPVAENGILRYDASTGEFVDQFVPEGSGGLNGSCCMVFGPDENLYVGSFFTASIHRYNGATGEYIDTFVASGNGGLVVPAGLTFGPDGNLYVGDVGTASILRYDGTTGAFIDAFVPSGSGGMDAAFGDPQVFEFGSDGHLYVASPATSSVLRFNGATGAFMGQFVASGAGGLQVPSGLGFGPDGELYVTDLSDVKRYDGSSGAFIDQFVSNGSGGLVDPVGIDFGPEDGNLYVASAAGNAVFRYDGATGAFIDKFVMPGSGGLSGPRLVLFKPTIKVCHSSSNNGATRTITVNHLTAGDHIAHGDEVGGCSNVSRAAQALE